DQYDNLATHTHRGIEFLDKYGAYVKERCAIELEYAGKLRYTVCKAFKQLLQELGDFAGQREVVAENLQSNVVRELHLLAKELREERKDLDEKRIKNIKNFMLSSVDVERKVFPIIMQCLDGMDRAANSINEKEDTKLVIDRYKSGFVPPEDFAFETATSGDTTDSTNTHHHVHNHLTAARGTVSGNRNKKRGGILITCQWTGRRTFQIYHQTKRRRNYKPRRTARLARPPRCTPPPEPTAPRRSKPPGDIPTYILLTEANSQSSVSTGVGVVAARAAGGSPESGLGGELAAAPHANGDQDHEQGGHESDGHESDIDGWGEPDLHPVGYCKALYAFEGIGSGSTMRMESGERLLVLETDAGDGWTRVRRHHTREEGFVPTTYIATTLYADPQNN
ncbi:Formin-binding protein 1-like protein, partial [Operophtera brumata]